MTNPCPGTSNGFALINGKIVTYGSPDFGLLYYAAKAFADFTLRLEFRITNPPTRTPASSPGFATHARPAFLN